MKKSIFIEHLLISQCSFRVLFFKALRPEIKIFTLVRRQLNLLFKSALVIGLIGERVTVKKMLSDFYLIYSSCSALKINHLLSRKIGQQINPNDRSKITKVTYKSAFKVSVLIADILRFVKRAKLENTYDFFNFPIKFNATLELSQKDFLALSMLNEKN